MDEFFYVTFAHQRVQVYPQGRQTDYGVLGFPTVGLYMKQVQQGIGSEFDLLKTGWHELIG